MNILKRLVSALLVCCFALAAVPAFTAPAGDSQTRGLNTGVTVDTDPEGGYAGDYVVIYNPSSDMSTAASTGSLAGLIQTDLSANVMPARSMSEGADSDIPYIIDVDYEMNHLTHKDRVPVSGAVRETYHVGSRHDFTLMGYAPGDAYEFTYEFVVLAVGAHCTIWTTTNPDYHPLDAIDESYAQIAADRFDEKFELMQVAYGDFNDVNGDGKVNLLFYNIDDGWQPGQGYVAGFFTYEDFQYNNLPMIHIDTYPGIKYTNSQGVEIDHFDDCFGTLVHEFQHCINYSETGGMHVWLNEALSGSAEELCFPGSGLFERIPSWMDHDFTSVSELQNPPVEYEYNHDLGLHTGGSLYAWDSSQLDIYARYAEVMLFTQYLYTRYGDSSVFKKIIRANSGDSLNNSIDALTSATGWSLESIWQGFVTAMIANDAASGFGFNMNEGYDPEQYYGIEDMYSLLSPVVYTGTQAADIYGGGFITVKPVGGVFNPPAGASSTLRYVGVKIGDVGLNGITLTPSASEILLDESANLVVARQPLGANNYDMVWTSSDESVVTVSGNRFKATAVAQNPGAAVVTATATDHETGEVYTAAATVIVRNGMHYTVYEPTSVLEKGKEYMIGAAYGDDVYVLMNYNPNPPSAGYGANNHYASSQSTEYSYGVKAVLDDEGRITGVDTSTYPDAVAKHAEWLFYDSDEAGYLIIRSAYNRNYHLRITNYDNYHGLYPQDGQSYAYKWQWDEQNNTLSYKFKSNVIKYVTFIQNVNNTYSNMFYAPRTASPVQLYKKTSGVVMFEDVNYYTVTFIDWDGSVLSSQQVAEGMPAAAPADPVREGYTFTGWDVDFSCITQDTVVTAQYEVNEPSGLLGDVDCSGALSFADVALLYQYVVGSAELTQQGLANADVDGSGTVSFADVSELYQRILLG